jgi:uncharacterized membrane protein YkvA (DUF1232 family)
MKFLRAIVHNIKVQAHAIWLSARDPSGYALSPIDVIPDFIPVLGLLDDAILIPLGIWLFIKIAPPEIFARNIAIAQAASSRPISKKGAVVVVYIWLALAISAAYLFGAQRWL